MLGSIIHNAHVVEDLGRKGVRRISRPDEVCEGETVIIRSHGEAKAVLEALEARGGRVVNSTCPRVLKIQQLVHRAEEEMCIRDRVKLSLLCCGRMAESVVSSERFCSF